MKKNQKTYEGPTFVATFDVKTEKWQNDMLEKHVFPKAIEFQNMMNRCILDKYLMLFNGDEAFNISCRMARIEDAIKALDAVKAKIDERAEKGEPLDERDAKFLKNYESRRTEMDSVVSRAMELFPDKVKYDNRIDDVLYQCFLYRKKALTGLVLNDKYVKFGYKPVRLSHHGLHALAGNMFSQEVSKSGLPFSFGGVNLAIARGCADRVWSAWDKKVFQIKSWKKENRIDTEKSEAQSVKFQNGLNIIKGTYKDGYVVFTFPGFHENKKKREMKLNLLVGKNDTYRKKCLSDYGEPQDASIVRIPNGTKYRYSVQVTLRGNPPRTFECEPKEGTMGIDIGPGGATCWCKATGAKKYWVKQLAKEANKIAELQRLQDASDRANNPDCYDEDGKIKRGAKIKPTKNGMRIRRKIASIRHKVAERIKNQKGFIINREIIPNAERFVIEETESKKWAKRDEKPRGKDGRKKRYGKAVIQFGPSDFINRLKRAAELNGKVVREVPCGIAATQFNPIEREFFPHEVEERTIHWGDNEIDRDAGAAFNLAHVADKIRMETKTNKFGRTYETPVKTERNYDLDGMYADYDEFIEDEKKMKEKS